MPMPSQWAASSLPICSMTRVTLARSAAKSVSPIVPFSTFFAGFARFKDCGQIHIPILPNRLPRHLAPPPGGVQQNILVCQASVSTPFELLPIRAILSAISGRHTNQLAREKSPYLLQHAHNPVDWFAWGDDGVCPGARGEQAGFPEHRLFHLPLVSCDGAGNFEDEPSAAF